MEKAEAEAEADAGAEAETSTRMITMMIHRFSSRHLGRRQT